MTDIIKVLPDSVANQIAAGEVVQRPASALKELMENAIDAGSSSISVVVKDGGKAYMQITDNGCGMSATDARLCFDRHATSKIREANDLFSIRTMGFRGEALASIAAVAQVEMKTRRHEDELGTHIIIEGSEVKSQEFCSCPVGTTFWIKNLFFNIPARRNFLKSTNVEYNHIVEEFQRLALANPEVAFSLYNGSEQEYKLDKHNFKQRVVSLFGNNNKERILPVAEETSYVQIEGFVGKPEFAKKTRGEQFFFINRRYIKHPYLHHALMAAYDDLISASSYPAYFINFTIDPARIDVNIHPTKTEVKFDDEKLVYNVLKAAVRLSIGKFHLTPVIDFNQDNSLDFGPMPTDREIKAPEIRINPDYNPFKIKNTSISRSESQSSSPSLKQSVDFSFDREEETTEELFQSSFVSPEPEAEPVQQTVFIQDDDEQEEQRGNGELFQVHGRYIFSNSRSGLIVIDQHGAHHRIIFEKLKEARQHQKMSIQQLMFPQTIDFQPADMALLNELLPDIKELGFDVEPFGTGTVIVHGVPANYPDISLNDVFEEFIYQYKSSYSELKNHKSDLLLVSLSKKLAIKPGKRLLQEEMKQLAEQLFSCREPHLSPSGRPTMQILTIEEIDKRFEKK